MTRWTIHVTLFLAAAFVTHAALGYDARRIEGIQRTHLVQFIQWLDLTDEQTDVVFQMHAAYWDEYMAELVPAARAYNTKLPSRSDPTFTEKYRELAGERAQIIALMEQWDHRLFSDIESVLEDDQLDAMRRVRFARQRQLWRTGRSELPEGNVHLSDLLLQLNLSEAERTATGEILDWYEPQLIQGLKNSRAALIEYAPIQRRRLEVETELTDRQVSAEDRANLFGELAFLYDKSARILGPPGEALVDINRRALRALHAVLLPENAETLQRLYLEASYPEVYPDPVNAAALYRHVLSFEDLTAEQREQVRARFVAFQRSHSAASSAIADVFMYRRRAGRSGGIEAANEAFTFDEILKAGLAREELNAKQIEHLATILTPGQIDRLPDTWNFELNPPPRPWDWGNRLRREDAAENRDKDRSIQ